MSLSRSSVNPLNVVGCRRTTHIPLHFTKIHTTSYDFQKIERWIHLNLNSRYCIQKTYKVINEKITEVYLIGIEEPHEATLLVLACPYLKN